MAEERPTIWTIGHSTRSLEEFLELLGLNRIEALADVRRFPGSRRYPHFGQDQLAASLHKAHIGYRHFPELGGRRRASPDSLNLAWRNETFRAYADFMETSEFAEGVEKLRKLARANRTAIMCAEAVWWRCHRGLISDFLKADGWQVLHILSRAKIEEHPFTSAASIVNGKLSYRNPPDGQQPALSFS